MADDGAPPEATGRAVAPRGVPPGIERDGPGVWFPPPFVYVAFAAVAWWLDRRWPLRPPEAWVDPLDAAGLVLVVVGLALDLSALALFWRARTSALPFRPATSFVARGPYRLTRNPMYLGLTLLVAGLGLTLEKLWLLPAALAGAAVIDRFVIPREERHLEARFGDGYRAYRRRVRRWI